jgi:hypothetical protein
MRSLSVILLFFIFNSSLAQNEFAFGQVSVEDLVMKSFDKDTAASAVVLKEYGHASIQDRDEIVLVFRHHVRMKILKSKGLEYANISVPLYKKNDRNERLLSVKASSYNIEDGLIKESSMNPKQVFTETIDKNWDQKKFAIPSVRVGSVIEYEFEVSSPYLFNFKSWNFQSEIPKLSSEYVATIPGNWKYNITLRGLLPLRKNDSEVLRDHFSTPAGKSDCVRYIWSMENIPAFYEEEYMTSKWNFLSSINFELLEVKYFDGRIDKVTKEWRDVEHELRTAENFGLQLRRGKDIVEGAIEVVIAQEMDPKAKAEKIFEFIRKWYDWNDKTSKYTDIGIKKAFDSRKGNVGDINLSLIAALRYAGLNVEPMILSTRDNGLPIELFPVLSDFNYVVAKLNIGDKVYLLDATEDFLPFGLLPQRCLNGKGRVLGERESYWYEINPAERSKMVSMINLVVGEDGKISGSVKNVYYGYRGAHKRSAVYSHTTTDEYVKELKKEQTGFEITDCKYENLDDIAKPLSETMNITLEDFAMNNARSFFFNPFLLGRWTKNPFHLSERLYPVDFGAPLEESYVITIDLPSNLQPTHLPEKAAIALPANGGKFLFNTQLLGSKLVMNSSLVINRPIFASQEYPSLKEFFNRVVTSQDTDLVFEKIVK